MGHFKRAHDIVRANVEGKVDMRPRLVLALCAVFVLAGCQEKAPESDSTPPGLHLRYFEKGPSGSQGAQKTISPGEQATIPSDWLGPDKADIRVVGDDDEGVRTAEVWGSALGDCEASEGSTLYPAPDDLPAFFPKQTETADQGYVKDFIAFNLDELMIDASCGTKQYQGMSKPAEFTMRRGKWTIYAHAENCCGGQTNGTFIVEIK
jgi:hypothetical protein